jgi:hypothetical protein
VFRADLTNIQVGPLTLQRGRENLPRLSSHDFGPIKQFRHTRPDDPRVASRAAPAPAEPK